MHHVDTVPESHSRADIEFSAPNMPLSKFQLAENPSVPYLLLLLSAVSLWPRARDDRPLHISLSAVEMQSA